MRYLMSCSLGLALLQGASGAQSAPAWAGFAGNAQHSAQSSTAPQPFGAIHWTTSVDDMPQIVGGELLIHYASPMITAANTVLVPVKAAAAGSFRIEARSGATGALLWTLPTNYVPPPHDWMPPLPAVLSPANRLSVAAAGGVVLSRSAPDSATAGVARSAFYGLAAHDARAAAYNAAVEISTPLTAGAGGALYFGFTVAPGSLLTGTDGRVLRSGLARLSPDGSGVWVAASDAASDAAGDAAGDAAIDRVAMNAAPALSRDGNTVYAVVSNGTSGELLALDSGTLATKSKVALTDPSSGAPAWIFADSSASPLVGPDGDVYFGVLESPFPQHNDRGWLLHFDAALTKARIAGTFGWDNTASIVPAASVPSYKGASHYLLMSKDNNYLGSGTGDGLNRIALFDPHAAAPDPVVPSVRTMAMVQSVLGPTDYPGTSQIAGTGLYPRYEWCINSAVVDVRGGTIIANSEDGHLYHWNLQTGQIVESILLNPPRPEAYTMTVIGPDGTVYAINNATLYAIGR